MEALDKGMAVGPTSPWYGYLAVVVAALAPLAAFRDSVTSATAALVLVLVFVASAATGIGAAGLVADFSSGAWFDFFPTKPYLRFSIPDRNDSASPRSLLRGRSHRIGLSITGLAGLLGDALSLTGRARSRRLAISRVRPRAGEH